MPTSPTVGDYLNLSNWSYNNRVIGTAATAPVGWVAVAAQADPKTGFQATAFQNSTTGQIVLAVAGTQILNSMTVGGVETDFLIARASARMTSGRGPM